MNPFQTTIILLLLPIIFRASAGSTSTSQWLDGQNQARLAVGCSPLTWDRKLEAYAQWYGNQRRFDCAMVHSSGPYGENLFLGDGPNWSPAQAVQGWVSEKRWYDSHTNSCSGGEDCGHYTQIVWKETQRVGCARVVCVGGAGVIFVCEYDPPGNFYGDKPY